MSNHYRCECGFIGCTLEFETDKAWEAGYRKSRGKRNEIDIRHPDCSSLPDAKIISSGKGYVLVEHDMLDD